MRALVILFALLVAVPASAQTFPPLSGRVVDQASLLAPAQEAELTARLEALERASSRQLVVATVSSLEDLAIEDYGNRLARHWRIGQQGSNNGVVLLVAPTERKVRIEVGYGLEGIMTDALSSRIIRERITPRFREGDYGGGILAGADSIIEQLQAPPEAAEQRAAAAARAERGGEGRRSGNRSPLPLIFWGVVLVFVILPVFGAGFRGRRYRRGRRGGVSIWGPGMGSRRDSSGLGWMLAGIALSNLGGRGGGGSWGGGGGSWGGGGGGFSGGGGSFGGGGASGGW